ncbi:MAG: ATP-binding protein [Spirochaetales bacterium]
MPILLKRANQVPVVTLLGPRQAGKTTLVKYAFPDYTYANLENPAIREFAIKDPKGFFSQYAPPVILDEIQRVPQLLSWIQVIVDEEKKRGLFILTGSNQPQLRESISQSLAGRTTVLTLLPLSLEELKQQGIYLDRDKALFQGFLPRLYDQSLEPTTLYLDYYATYMDRDIRQMVNIKDSLRFETFMRLLAGRVGQVLNTSSLANDVGVSHTTIVSWLSVLESSFITFRLPPWLTNISKRYIKSPKIYFYEPGLLASLLQLNSLQQVSRDPLLGNLFENLIVLECVKALYNRDFRNPLFFYREQAGIEIDLILEHQRLPNAIEIKCAQTFHPDFVRSLYGFKERFPQTSSLRVVYGGNENIMGSDYQVFSFRNVEAMVNWIVQEENR